MVRVALDFGDDQCLYSRITQESAELLQLKKGMKVMALFKATAVLIQKAATAQANNNVLTGKVARMASDSKGGEVSLILGSGSHVVGFSQPNQNLKVKSLACAKVEESSVVIALLD